MRALACIFLGLALLQLGSCAQVTRADYRQTIEAPPDAHPAPVMFSHYKLDLPMGEQVGVISAGSRFCGWPHEPVSRNYMRDALDGPSLRDAFNDTLESQGYDVVGNRDVMFDLEEDLMRGEFKVSARITAVELNACEQEPGVLLWLLTSRSGVEGEIFMEVDWTVYDILEKKIVYRTRTEGYGKRSIPNEEGLSLLAADAFEMAAHNLGADAGFYQLVFTGKRPETARPEPAPGADRPRQFDPREAVTLPALPLSATPFEKQAEHIRKAALTIETGIGHGSGFFISREGHILTNHHVVGTAQHVRVKLPDYPEALVAEVLRTDTRRDAALLRLKDMPEGLVVPVLPLRREWPGVSETVYAVGAPTRTILENTVTRGIVSAHRKEFKGSRRQNRIQADVEIHGGNSGGPLLDAYGNIVAICVEGYDEGGLNLFIPIDEALRDLDIGVAGDAVVNPPISLVR